jgi:hypothetical protein
MRIKQFAKKCVKHSVGLARLYYWYVNRLNAEKYPDWGNIIKKDRRFWDKVLQTSGAGQKILLATSMGSLPAAVIMDSFLAAALTLRGADVHVLLCDSFLPACLMCEYGLIRPRTLSNKGVRSYLCNNCFSSAYRMFEPIGVKIHKYSDFVSTHELEAAELISSSTNFEEISQYKLDDIAVGEHAMAGALRFFAQGTLDGQTYAEPILRLYFKSAILAAYSMRRLLKDDEYECACCINGIYVPQGIVGEVARSEKVRVVNWNVAYRKSSFIFSHGDTYHHTLMTEPVEKWEHMRWVPQLESEIMNYLISRQRGGRDWIAFLSKNAKEDLSVIANEMGNIDFSKPCIGMLTNVVWDAQLHYPANAFPNMIDWVLKTIEYFSKRPELQLIIRIHPAEVSGDIPSRQPIMVEIKENFSSLPKNVFIIRPESKISTYRVMEQCNAAIIYGTKTGVELTSRGIPVIVAGEAWIRNKGLTLDAKSAEHYFEILNELPFFEGMAKEQIEKARKYAYHFFFRRMIPVQRIAPTGGQPQFQVKLNSIRDLLPHKDPGLDIICDGILKNTDFIYSAEQFSEKSE